MIRQVLFPRFLTSVFAYFRDNCLHLNLEVGDRIEVAGRAHSYGYELLIDGGTGVAGRRYGVLFSASSGMTAVSSEANTSGQGAVALSGENESDGAITARFPVSASMPPVRHALARSRVNGKLVQTDFPVILVG